MEFFDFILNQKTNDTIGARIGNVVFLCFVYI